jgi:hypothetical protein
VSVIIRLKNTTFANTGLPRLIQTVYGFPADGLEGLYLMEDGEVGVAHAGMFADASGKGNHAARRGDWPAPLRRDYGFEAASPNGLAIETPVPMTPSMTWIFAGRRAAGLVDGYPLFFAPSTCVGATAAGANTIPVDREPILNAMIVAPNNNNWGIFTNTFWFGAGNNRVHLPNASDPADVPSVIGMSFDNDSGVLVFKSLHSRLSYAGLAGKTDEWKTNQAKVVFGWCRYGSTSNQAGGEVMLAACYSRGLSEAELDAAMEAARARVAARGVVFA